MLLSRSLLFSITACLFLTASVARGQSSIPSQPVHEAPTTQESQTARRPKLSPGAEEVSRTIGVAPLIERLYSLPEHDRGVGGPMSLEALSLRQEITEYILGAALEVDGLITEIDSELAQISEARAQLEARRDRALAISSLATVVAGGLTGVLGTALQLNENTSRAGNVIGTASGGVSTLLSIIGLHQQRGGKLPLGVSPNMLAKLFDRKPEFHSDYPEEIWTYLNAVPPSEDVHETRRAHLIKEWEKEGRIESKATPKAQHKIDLLTSGVSDKRQLTIDLLNDRAAMLADVRAGVSLMKRDLSKLLQALLNKTI